MPFCQEQSLPLPRHGRFLYQQRMLGLQAHLTSAFWVQCATWEGLGERSNKFWGDSCPPRSLQLPLVLFFFFSVPRVNPEPLSKIKTTEVESGGECRSWEKERTMTAPVTGKTDCGLCSMHNFKDNLGLHLSCTKFTSQQHNGVKITWN